MGKTWNNLAVSLKRVLLYHRQGGRQGQQDEGVKAEKQPIF